MIGPVMNHINPNYKLIDQLEDLIRKQRNFSFEDDPKMYEYRRGHYFIKVDHVYSKTRYSCFLVSSSRGEDLRRHINELKVALKRVTGYDFEVGQVGTSGSKALILIGKDFTRSKN